MIRSIQSMFRFNRQLHALASENGPSETLKKKLVEIKKLRKKRKSSKKDEFVVTVPESSAFLDTPTLPMVLTAVAIVLFAKLLMLHHDSTSQERLERKMKKLPPGTGTMRMVSREEWDQMREITPRTPFESKYARPNARIRTGEPVHLEDLKDWTIDVFRDALTRAEENAKGKR